MAAMKYQKGDDLNIEFRFFFDNKATEETFQTNNEPMAWAKYHSCLAECELWADGELLAAKYHEYDDINDVMMLLEETNEDAERVDLEPCEL